MQLTNSGILAQLNTILASPAFKSSVLLSQFLSYVVEQTLIGNGGHLKAYTIAIEAFDRDSNFDPQQDSIVRNYAARLRKELSHYYNEFGQQDEIRIDIPKGKYVPEFSIIEIGKSKNPISTGKTITKRSINIYKFVIAVLFLVVLTFVAIQFSPDSTIRKESPAIVFYEFRNLTSNPDNDKWIHSLTEEIAILSSEFAEIDIIGPVNEDGVNKQELDEKINTKNLFVLNGSVVALDSILIVNVRLLDFKSDKVIWASTIEKEISSKSLMDIEYEICSNIALKVSGIYGAAQTEVLKKSTNSSHASLKSHLSVLTYFQYLRNITYKDYIKTKKKLEKTIKEDPDNAIAFSALATIYIDGYWYFNEDSVSSFLKSHNYLNKALNLDPENVFVQSHRIYISYASRKLTDFYDAIEKVEMLNPLNVMIGEIGVFLVFVGDSKKGLKLIRESQNSSIVYPGYFHGGAFIYYYNNGDFEKALIEAEMINMPDFFIDPLFRAIALVKLGRIKEANYAKQELLKIVPDFATQGRSGLDKIFYNKQDVCSMIEDLSIIE